ncbi:MAG TPA: hypothetical protein VIB08_11590, partial [Thermoanaerobaculia bacterium]
FADELGPERPQLAYEILAGVTGRGADLAFYRVAAAGWLAKAQGQEAADRWLGEAIPPNVRAFASSAYFDSGQDRLLWTLAAPPGGEPLPVTWLLRASAYRLRGGDAEQQEQLEKFAHSAPPDDPHHALTVRYLLEKPDAYPSELPEVPGARATWAWAAAVDRMARGDYPAASDLFHLTQLLDRGTGTGGYLGACAYKCVRDWLDAERPLAEIAASDREVVKTGTKQN